MNPPACCLVPLPVATEGTADHLECQTCGALVPISSVTADATACPGRPELLSVAP